MNVRLAWVVAITIAFAAPAGSAAQQYDTASLLKFRADRETTLKGDNSWLTVAGLHFLNPGDNRVGSDPTNDIILDFPSVPKHVGVITLNGRAVRIRAAQGQTLIVNDKPVTETELHGSFDGKPNDLVKFGDVSFFVHYSGPRLALRVRDQKSVHRTNFRGLRWYEPDPAYRTIGTFTPYPEPKVVQVPNILGDLEPFNAVGTVTFSLRGKEHTMEAWRSRDRLWFVFRDLTSGRETYPSARFLYVPAAVDGRVIMDFNYAENPPCAVNPFTTCPLPPPQNRLTVPVEAGEKRYVPAGTATQ
jgi:uncharacterized protein (DUF1684 family)